MCTVYDARVLHKTAESLLRKPRAPTYNIKDSNGVTIDNVEDELKRWHQYTQELFDSSRTRNLIEPHSTPVSLPTVDETRKAIKSLKNDKATGSDDVMAEFIKAAASEQKMFECLHEAVCHIWNTGTWPPSMTTSIYIALHKKNDRGVCGNYRTLALISHASKIVLNILQTRLERIAQSEVSQTQYGFTQGKGTIDAIHHLKGVSEAYLAARQKLHLTFVDYRKAFDSVDHPLLFSKLRELKVDEDVVRLIENLYSNANGYLSWKGGFTETFATPVGVRQGCPLSPVLFSLYTECLMREWYRRTARITSPNVNGMESSELRYADDLVMMALERADAERQLNILGDISKDYGLIIHPGKTEYMVIDSNIDDETIQYGETPIPRVNSFKYLGTTITHDLNDSNEIKMRVGMGKAAMRNCRYLKMERVSIDLKVALIRSLVLSKVLYGSNTWILKKADIKKLNAFGREIWRHLLRITWEDKVSNEQLQDMIGDKWLFSANDVLTRKASWCGHVIRQEGIIMESLCGLPNGYRRRPGGQRKRWLDNVIDWSGRSSKEIFEMARARVQLGAKEHVVVNVYNLRSGRQRASAQDVL